MTKFRVGNEKLYLSPIMDLVSREIITYQIRRRQSFGLFSKMLKEALSKRTSGTVPMIHREQGCLYQLSACREILMGKKGFPKAIQSMSRKGNCYCGDREFL
ncbi:hypothetical protein [Avibacterium paragallinarum]|uniref:Integrase core domain n=2 Tax=Avibacterium paragallinarum TaxID=728 RepID=A0AAE5TJN7_AVIPA|nr:hypothetical protein [Avibacterium paragallinarum]MEE3607451.1 hypothetical protein [Avibacterium paragallinarum]MEE3622128.1 hypothetical protein [Avibacterium paragallinarum]MEE3669460.1 hypothetical protein [Avibacterium paragallinarum]MEE3681990.1 hypothetical protein [Avibacterium paragallinarum]PXZ39886.1 hypothetical protein DM482_03930 [Avibacterium paragallinarum]